jgi:chromosomal replication initiator protein
MVALGVPSEVFVSVAAPAPAEAEATVASAMASAMASATASATAPGAERRRRGDGGDPTPATASLGDAPQQPTSRAARSAAPSNGAAARPSRAQSFRRLEDFVVGESNRLGFAASEQFGDGSAEAPSILFIHGECGVGKTHLIQGLCRRRLERAPRQVIRYVTAEQFTNEYIASVRAGTLDEFRKRLRRVDLLAIDDIHFFANKTATQAEFLHTIDAIDLTGARIALVSDEHPRHIRRFSQSLVSRFLSGMVVKIDRPDRLTRVELVRRLARDRGLDLTTAAEDAVAGRCAGSIREVEGAITRLGALVELDGLRGQIGPGTVERLLGDEALVSVGSQPIRLGKIIEGVCERLRVNREDLLGSGRHARTVVARGVVAHLARELTTHSYPEIARALGRDTHSAVHTAAKRLRTMIDGDERIAAGGERAGGEKASGEKCGGESIREVVDQLRHDLARNGRDR